jgi:hypothetical protein
MSNDILVKFALQRQEVFKNLTKYLKIIKEKIAELDPNAEVYLFGSVAENNYSYSSDIDILVFTNLYPAKVHAELWKAGSKTHSKFTCIRQRKPVFLKEQNSKKFNSRNAQQQYVIVNRDVAENRNMASFTGPVAFRLSA